MHGPAVDEARQLCAAAAAGTILAGPAVHLLAGTRSEHTLRPKGPVRLPGAAELIETFDVAWEPGATGRRCLRG